MSKQNKPAQTPAPAGTQAPEDKSLEQTNDANEQSGGDQGTGGDKAAEQGADTTNTDTGAINATSGEVSTEQAPAATEAPAADEVEAIEPAAEEKGELLAETSINIGMGVGGWNPVETIVKEQADAAAIQVGLATMPGMAFTSFQEQTRDAHAAGGAGTKALIDYLDQYVERMAVNQPENPAVWNQQQVALYNTIFRVLETEEDFDKNFSILLAYFKEHSDAKGVFHASNNFRGLENASLAADQRSAFLKICQLINAASRVKQFNQIQMNIDRAVSEGIFSEDARRRVFNFLQVG